MFTYDRPTWDRRWQQMLDTWNRENPTKQAELEWVEDLAHHYFLVGKMSNNLAVVDPEHLQFCRERVWEMARRIPHKLVWAITQNSNVAGKGHDGGDL